MAAPIINIFESDDATDAAAWDAGTIKAGMTSDARKSADPKKDIKEIHVWNNYNQTTAGSNMIECTVTTLAADGTDKMTSKTGATPVDYEHIQYDRVPEADRPYVIGILKQFTDTLSSMGICLRFKPINYKSKD